MDKTDWGFVAILLAVVVGVGWGIMECVTKNRAQEAAKHGHFRITDSSGTKIDAVWVNSWARGCEFVKADGSTGEIRGNFTVERLPEVEKP